MWSILLGFGCECVVLGRLIDLWVVICEHM